MYDNAVGLRRLRAIFALTGYNEQKISRVSRGSISPNLAGKILAKSDCAVSLWCLLMDSALEQVNDGPVQ